jgi:hypothetical protein
MPSNATPRKKIWIVTAATLPLLAVGLAAQQATSLVVDGHSGTAKVVQVQGHNFVDVDGLVRITNGTISFKGNAIVLGLPSLSSAPSSEQEKGLSHSFLLAGIEVGARIREWHAALRTAVERGVPLTTGWLNNYQEQADQSLRLAQVAIQSDADRAAYPLLQAEFGNMKSLQDKYVGMATNLQYIDPNSLASDPLDQKVVGCGRALTSMASTTQFTGEGACQ